MDYKELLPAYVLHWNYRGLTEFPIEKLTGEETEVTDIYLKENLISKIPPDISKLEHLESLYLSGNDITELPREISKLRCLKCLDISGNRLRAIPEEIGEVVGLKFLILDENELTELPLRIAELRGLRYLSVCDNQLEWLPQRPVYNYHHCEFRFWRNKSLRTIPYSMWYHMFRDQQVRSLNIGCLSLLKHQQTQQSRCRLKINRSSREDLDLDCPQYNNILESSITSPPSLLEICKRVFYQILSDTAKNLSNSTDYFSIYSNNFTVHNCFKNGNQISNLEDEFGDVNIKTNANEKSYDMNGNNLAHDKVSDFGHNDDNKRKNKSHYNPADVLNESYRFLPRFITQELSNGPASRCEHVHCKKPIFNYAIYEFCIGMVFKYKRKTNQASLSEDSLQKAIKEVKEDKQSINATATKYGIPYVTLYRHLKSGSIVKKLGRFTAIFTPDQEKGLCEYLKKKIILIDNVEDVILSAALCSKTCSDLWKRGKPNLLAWSLFNDSINAKS